MPKKNFVKKNFLFLILLQNFIFIYFSIMDYKYSRNEGRKMKLRTQGYGNANMVGKNIERLRKERGIKQKDFIAQIQTMGVDINPTSYSKLEG